VVWHGHAPERQAWRQPDAASLAGFLAAQPVSEYLLTAVDAEGHAGRFPLALLDAVGTLPEASVIWFGGLDAATMQACLQHRLTAAVAFGNPLHETEHAVPRLRAATQSGARPDVLRSPRAF
jgi:imidazole glycerol phosphate synthase subunit HisF